MAKKKTVEPKVIKEDPDNGANVASIQTHPIPDTKTGAMGALMQIFQQMSTEQALNFLNLTLQQIGHEADNIPDGTAQRNAASISMKPSDASMRETYEADVLALFGDQELAEDHKEKVLTLFEAALNARVAAERVSLDEEYEARLDEEIKEVTTFFEDKIDEYLTYGMKKWIEENQVAIQNTLAAEKAGEFFEDLLALCSYHNVPIPDESVDVVEELKAQLEQAHAERNEAVSQSISLSNALEEYRRSEALDSVSEGLALTQKEKLKTMVESFEFNDGFADKVKTVRDQHFGKGKGPSDTGIIVEDVNEDTGSQPKRQSHPGMERYVAAVSMTAKSIVAKKTA